VVDLNPLSPIHIHIYPAIQTPQRANIIKGKWKGQNIFLEVNIYPYIQTSPWHDLTSEPRFPHADRATASAVVSSSPLIMSRTLGRRRRGDAEARGCQHRARDDVVPKHPEDVALRRICHP
jgi:hypothetical protein